MRMVKSGTAAIDPAKDESSAPPAPGSKGITFRPQLPADGSSTCSSSSSSASRRRVVVKSTGTRHVSVPGSGFEATANGMGLKRSEPGSSAAQAAKAATSVDFKRQRIADAARAAKGRVLCWHFCRHGRCDGRAGTECPYEHDPARVAICQAFLHGTCPDDGRGESTCPLSHSPSAANMPDCRLFARGLCVDGTCQYSHVHRGTTAPLCEAFSRCGYCVEGAACGRRHDMACDAFAATGSCALGNRCKLRQKAGPRKLSGAQGLVPRLT